MVEPRPPVDGELRVRVLGTFEVAGVDLRELRSRKARTALKVLALGRGAVVSVDRLVEVLWPDGEQPARPEREVAVNLSRVRARIGAERVERHDAGYRLVLDWLDLDVVEDLAAEVARRVDAGDLTAAHTAARAALALVRGPLLADEVDALWLEPERASVARVLAGLRANAALTAHELGAHADAAALAAEAIACDPFDEASVRVLMRTHVATGRPGSALAVYAELRARLLDELGARPAAATEALHAEVLALDAEPAARTDRVAAMPGDTADRVADVASLPGRAGVLAELGGALDRAADGLELVVVEGIAGAGKTAVLDAFAAGSTARGVQVLRARCDEVGQALPLQPFADALAAHRRLAGATIAPADPAAARDDEVLAPLLGLAPPPPTAIAPAAGVDGFSSADEDRPVEPASVPGPAMSADAMQALVFGALARVLGRIAARGPTALLIDDVHLAGPSTRAFLQFARRRREELPLLVVATRRPDEGAPIDGATATLDLAPLDLDAVTAVVGPERAPALLARSGGNALLVVELASAGDDDLPDSIRSIVQARLERASAPVVASVRAAAILGRDVDLDVLAAVVDRPPLDVLDDLEDAVQRQFLHEQLGRFTFRHDLLREALVAGTSSARRTHVHRAAAQALAARRTSTGEGAVDPLALAHHARLGELPALAAVARRDAAARAVACYDLADAEAWLDEAIDLDDGAEVRIERAHVRAARSDLDGVEEDALAAMRLGRRAAGLSLRAWVARHRHDLEAAIRIGTEGAAVAAAEGDATAAATSLLAVAFGHRGLGDLERADESLVAAQAVGAPTDLGLRGWTGVLRVHQGRPAEALDLLAPSVGTDIDVVHGYWVEHVLQMAAHAEAMQGRPAAALATIDRLSTEMVRRGSDVRYAGLDENYRAWILTNLGDPAAAEHSERAIETAGQREAATQARLDLAATRRFAGDLAAATDLVDEAARSMATEWFHNRWRCEQRVLLLRALIALDAGDLADGVEHARTLAAEATARGDRRYATMAAVLIARGTRTPTPHAHELTTVAGLEAWWLLADLAAATRDPHCWTLAEHAAHTLATHAGPHATPFTTRALTRFKTLPH